jgi:hypothetical protein
VGPAAFHAGQLVDRVGEAHQDEAGAGVGVDAQIMVLRLHRLNARLSKPGREAGEERRLRRVRRTGPGQRRRWGRGRAQAALEHQLQGNEDADDQQGLREQVKHLRRPP